ncbi:MAG: hypothetical protein P1Q69_17210 [Candidatus Thorarchaeota archaeon]|nr:hypothetical protein [Candidatus Thorarchaeota archaeon]
MSRPQKLSTLILLCFLLFVMFQLSVDLPLQCMTKYEVNATIPSQDTPVLPVVSVSIPRSPQLGTWQIAITLFSSDSIDVSIELSILLDGTAILNDEMILPPGETYVVYSYDMSQLSTGDRLMLVEILISLDGDSASSSVYSGFVVAQAAWQVGVILYIVPILAIIMVLADFLRKYTLKRSAAIESAGMNERGDAADKSLAFSVYLNRGLTKSAIRMAAALELPEQMLRELATSGSKAYSTLSQLASAYDEANDYEKASNIYGHLNLEAPYRRTSIFMEVEKGNLESAVAQFSKMTSSRYGAEAVKLVIDLYEQGKAKEAVMLCNGLGEKIRNLTIYVSKDMHRIEVFSSVLKELDSDEIKLNMLCTIGSVKAAAEVIAKSTTLKEIAIQSNLVSLRYRNEVVLLVTKNLAVSGKFKTLSGYMKALNLTTDNESKLITSVVRDLVNDPSSVNLRRFLKILSTGATPANKKLISEVLDSAKAIASLSAGPKTISPNISVSLRSIKYIHDYDIAKKLLDRIHTLVIHGRKMNELSSEELAAYSQQLRAITYQLKGTIAEYLKKRLQPMEDALRPIIQKDAKERVLQLLIHPDDEMKLTATSKHLTLKLLEDFPMQNPTAMAQALYELTRLGTFPELKRVVDTITNNNSLIQFAMDTMKNAERRERLITAARRYGREYPSYRSAIPVGRVLNVTRSIAISVWAERIHNVWFVGVLGALDTVVQQTMTRDDVPQRQKVLLVAAYINRLHFAPSKIEGLVLKTVFDRICTEAGFSTIERKEIISESKLPRHIANGLLF